MRIERSLTTLEEDEMQIQVMGLMVSLPAVPMQQSRPDAGISFLLRVEIDCFFNGWC